ncbi:hypothetical protein [Mucilaginibacter sp. SP1R1]|uniref:hypothetical protein n=1 Tax=Mucilaginibacter sp. SP1R1 TaxID=2723091 RepID=UPI00161B00E5|nr:hypothetical protein [Mucilaginibacter sp. SP1R1]MBB6147745.1 hypothetical protein [Mucilaginibacter sp. SP1R1]
MLWKLTKTLLALCGIPFGGWIASDGASFYNQKHNNWAIVVLISGFILSGSCVTYLVMRLIYKNIFE